jgi:hypothetical protein
MDQLRDFFSQLRLGPANKAFVAAVYPALGVFLDSVQDAVDAWVIGVVGSFFALLHTYAQRNRPAA